MNIDTHKRIDAELCGSAAALEKGASRVELTTVSRMAVDDTGLVHGGFVFGLADYAAMIAVNHPNVVLGAAEVRFLKPVRSGEKLVAEARVESTKGKKQVVPVTVTREGEPVFEGTFTCFVLDRHVLS
ncbi:MAG: hotdog domain-containing protein [Desulfobacterales bacterium]